MSNVDILLSEKHKEAIADYIDQQIMKSEYGETCKIEQILRQSAINIEQGLSNFHRHRLFEVNPTVKSKVEKVEKAMAKQMNQGFDAGFRSNQYPQDIGINIPHFNTALQERQRVTPATIGANESRFGNP